MRWIIIFSLFLSASLAHASATSILLEPYLGYGVAGSLSYNNLDAGTFSGMGFGARLGVSLEELFFGAIDTTYYPTAGYSIPAGAIPFFSGNPNNYRLGLVAGIALPIIPLRFWVGYNFIENFSGNTSSYFASFGSSGTLTANGTSFKFGVGYKLIPFISLNAEYITSSLSNYSSASASGTLPNASGKVLVFSASVPLSF